MAGNRDEFHARPTAPLQRWAEPYEAVIAGRDLRSGGSWMGANVRGHAAVVTNVRDPTAPTGGPSRGELIAGYLSGSLDSIRYTEALANRAGQFAPFNLLIADAEHCAYLGNHPAGWQNLPPGVHGMSNGSLDAPWPKTLRLMRAMEKWLAQDATTLDAIWQALADESRPTDSELPHTGVPMELERRLSSAFIRGADYGTRASTVIVIDHAGQGFIHERRFGPEGVFLGETRAEIPGDGN